MSTNHHPMFTIGVAMMFVLGAEAHPTTAGAATTDGQLTISADEAAVGLHPQRKPKPATKARVTRERLRLTATTTTEKNRLTLNPPPSRQTDKATHQKPRKSIRETSRLRSTPRTEIRLNIGMCGRVQPDGTVPGPAWCQPFEPTRRTPGVTPSIGVVVERRPRPQDVTWEMVLTETKDSLFVKLPVFVQPKGRTLVNLDTIVYTRAAEVYVDNLTLLDFPVVVEATPMKYIWQFGDGTQKTTTSPGAPYPSKEITHKYTKRAQVGLTVTAHYAVCYTVADLGRQCIDNDIPVTGPATPLTVREAVPVLVNPER